MSRFVSVAEKHASFLSSIRSLIDGRIKSAAPNLAQTKIAPANNGYGSGKNVNPTFSEPAMFDHYVQDVPSTLDYGIYPPKLDAYKGFKQNLFVPHNKQHASNYQEHHKMDPDDPSAASLNMKLDTSGNLDPRYAGDVLPGVVDHYNTNVTGRLGAGISGYTRGYASYPATNQRTSHPFSAVTSLDDMQSYQIPGSTINKKWPPVKGTIHNPTLTTPGFLGGGKGLGNTAHDSPTPGISKPAPAVKNPMSKTSSQLEKSSVVDTALVGSLLGAYGAPKGRKLEGLGRGAVRGAGTGLGAILGLAGGTLPILALANSGNYELARSLTLPALAAGAGLGGYGGYNLAGNIMGMGARPSWETDKKDDDKMDKKGSLAIGGGLAGLSGLLGAATSPKKHKLEGIGRGLVRGVGTGLGSTMGAIGGLGVGGVAVPALTSLLLQSGHPDLAIGALKASPELLATSTIAGAGLGGMGGYSLAGSVLGAPSWKDKAKNDDDGMIKKNSDKLKDKKLPQPDMGPVSTKLGSYANLHEGALDNSSNSSSISFAKRLSEVIRTR